MLPILAAALPYIIPAVATLVGMKYSADTSAKAQSEANETNIRLAEENREYNTEMTNTAYQRGMADMKAAGLNPMLAYQQGGAQSIGSSAATVEPVTGSADMVAKMLPGLMSSAMEAKRLEKDMSVAESQIQANKATSLRQMNEAMVADRQRNLLDLQMPAFESKARFEKMSYDMDQNRALMIANKLSGLVTSGLISAAAATKLFGGLGKRAGVGMDWDAERSRFKID